ncbi:MAG: BspA family leucine-rich repeat surface protein [Saprospiraceae bacterium]
MDFAINATDIPDLSQCFRMESMFAGSDFTGDVTDWNVSNVQNFQGCFASCQNFNQDLSDWDVSSANNLREMFNFCQGFNQDLSKWNIPSFTSAFNLFSRSGVSIQNYDSMLDSWSKRASPPTNVNFSNMDGMLYCESEDDRTTLITAYSWAIAGDAKLGINNTFTTIVGESCTGSLDGSINVSVANCADVNCNSLDLVEYAIDGGTYQSEPFFENLTAGNHTISLRGVGTTCEVMETINVPLGPDVVAPELVTQNITRALDGSGMLNLTPAELDNGTTDNCTIGANLTFELEQSSFSCQDFNGINGTPCVNVTTIAGSIERGSDDGTGAAAKFDLPFALTVAPDGNVYVADRSNHTIRKVTPAGVVTTFAGQAGVSGLQDGVGANALFFRPAGIDHDAAGNLYVSDGNNRAVRKITPAGEVTTLAGSGVNGSQDGTGSMATFGTLRGLAVDKSNGNIYVADAFQHTIRKITPSGEVTTLAGVAGQRAVVDGVGTNARFNSPRGLTVDNAGNVYVTETSGQVIRKITPAGVVTTFAGMAETSGADNGIGTNAFFSFPSGIAVDDKGVFYVADQGNSLIRRITPSGQVTTLAGRVGAFESVDGLGPVGSARAINIALDAATGDFYFCDISSVRKIELIDDCFSTQFTATDENDNASTGLVNITFTNPEACDAIPGAFVTTWTVDAADLDITIPTSSGFAYSYNVDWGDGTTDVSQTGDATHTYPSAGTYTVQIIGTFPHFFLNGNPLVSPNDNQLQLSTIEQWGTIAWGSMENAFTGAANMQYNATDAPNLTAVTNMANMFKNTLVTGDLSAWTTSSVTDMSGAFYGTPSGIDVSGWTTDDVTDMSEMFMYSMFDGDIMGWGTGMVTDMSNMFSYSAFDGNIAGWNTAAVQNMEGMFNEAYNFNQNIGSWDITSLVGVDALTNVLTLSGMSTDNYDATLTGWAAQGVTSDLIVGVHNLKYCDGAADRQDLIDNHNWTFQGDELDVANQCSDLPFITTWETTTASEEITIFINDNYSYDFTIDWGDGSAVENSTGEISHTYVTPGIHTVQISGLFPSFQASGEEWYPEIPNAAKLVSVEQWGSIEWLSMASAFLNAENLVINAFDLPLLEKVADMSYMFYRAKSMVGHPTMNDWDVSNVNRMVGTFRGAINFDTDLSKWETGSVRSMNTMFWNAAKFNQDLSTWDVARVTDMRSMFEYAFSFDQDLSGWDFSSLAYRQALNFAFSFTALSLDNYDDLLIALAGFAPSLPINMQMGAQGLNYCNGETARDDMINNQGWIITDAGKNCTPFAPGEDGLIGLQAAPDWTPVFKVFPNPTQDFVSIILGPTDTPYQELAIFNKLGQEMWKQELNTGATTIDISLNSDKFSAGIYYVNLFVKDKVITKKLMVVR